MPLSATVIRTYSPGERSGAPGQSGCAPGADFEGRGRDRQATAFAHGIAGVDREVDDDLGELTGIDFDMRAFLETMQMANDRDVVAEQPEE